MISDGAMTCKVKKWGYIIDVLNYHVAFADIKAMGIKSTLVRNFGARLLIPMRQLNHKN